MHGGCRGNRRLSEPGVCQVRAHQPSRSYGPLMRAVCCRKARKHGISSPPRGRFSVTFCDEATRAGILIVADHTAFISTSPGLTCPGLLAPDRRDAGSRRVGSRVHGRSEDRGYVVPQASDVSVAGDARWGSRPMAEHRVMSEDHLGLTHYRSRRCYESHPICQKPNGARSRRAGLLFQYAPNQAIPADKSIRSFPLAAAHPLTVLSWPEAHDASGSRRACLMHISRNARSLVALPDFPEFAQAVRYGVPRTPRTPSS